MATTQTGMGGYVDGAIADQTLLLQDIVDGLSTYNDQPLPYIAQFCAATERQVQRVPQAPKTFRRHADGAEPESQKMQYRTLTTPLGTWSLGSEFTTEYLQDALESDILAEMNGAILGDVELVNQLFFGAILTKRTVGSIGTAYQIGFYNGETDVPAYKNNSFSSAHYHYLGANSTTYTLAIHRVMMQDIREHGYGLMPGSLHAFFHSAQMADVQGLINSNTTILQAITGQREKGIDLGAWNTNLLIEGVEIHFDDNVPSGYTAMMASDVKPLSMREHFRPEYRGLMRYYKHQPPENMPLQGMEFMRRIGFAGRLPGAGTARQLVASTTYTNPTFRIT